VKIIIYKYLEFIIFVFGAALEDDCLGRKTPSP
jgi:hypothetical protein